MLHKHFRPIAIAIVMAAIGTAWAAPSFGIFHGHRRYPTGNSPTYPNATPHGGFSSSNGYYSGRSRIADAPPPVKAAQAKTGPAK